MTACLIGQETNDLIYEGIATFFGLFGCTIKFFLETNDLIYEGIATRFIGPIILAPLPETNDLIYEGIATASAHTFVTSSRA